MHYLGIMLDWSKRDGRHTFGAMFPILKESSHSQHYIHADVSVPFSFHGFVVLVGYSCDECRDGFYSFGSSPSVGCTSCSCNLPGTVNQSTVCHQTTGQCECKENVQGTTCNECKGMKFSTQLDHCSLFCQYLKVRHAYVWPDARNLLSVLWQACGI